MTNQTIIAADMQSAYEQNLRRPHKEIGLYLISSNRELLNHIEKIMNRYGAFGVMDASGRVHYLLDARKGIPLAEKKFYQTITTLLEDHSHEQMNYQLETQKLVNKVLSRYHFNQDLRGYRVLFTMLELGLKDYSLLNPISKRLYPQVAKIFRVTAPQVERNVRYLFEDLAISEAAARTSGTDTAYQFLSDTGCRLPVAKTVVKLWEICRLEAEETMKYKEKKVS
ncbi:MAG: sporulation initiation factor Spo0A C-terminal domain-containing protein [Eubacteriales bacterium]|nr:sporulation initiation factor Spo0A C-terminal domain-containing protein [Eubacteriales bacterium]MDD4540573.1 sporulation initiation factor Spo0A C-terminal domain-containing protein [Eubacteriales bacterium]